eukprot:scaffold9278_cov170-Cylindrotheca_fusiformis.AAC.1
MADCRLFIATTNLVEWDVYFIDLWTRHGQGYGAEKAVKWDRRNSGHANFKPPLESMKRSK